MPKQVIEILLEKLGDKIRTAKRRHETEWKTLRGDCPYREKAKETLWLGGTPDYGCTKINEDTANKKPGYYFCRFFNCPYIKNGVI